MKFSVVIPARNEAGNIRTTLDQLVARFREDAIDYEIIVVDDGCTDTTVQEVQGRAADDPGIRVVRNTAHHGFGWAVRRGLDAFTGDAVVIVMADGSDDPADVVRYCEILRDRAECAFGSRWMAGARVEDYPRFKGILNRAANTFIRVLFGLRYNDVTNAFKGYRRCVIEGCRPLLSPHFNLTVEIPLKAIVRGYSYEVVPIRWRNRTVGHSSLQIEEMGSRYLYIVLHIWLEKMLTKGDYRRPREEKFAPWEAPGDRSREER